MLNKIISYSILLSTSLLIVSCGSTNSSTKTVGEKPIIKLIGPDKITLTKGSNFNDPGFKATDSEDGDITKLITKTSNLDTSKEGTYTITYTVTDSNGNTTTLQRQITIQKNAVDNTPNIKLKGDSNISLIIDDNFTDLGAIATDVEDGDISNLITKTSDLNISSEGNYTISYSVTDSGGNTATINRGIEVQSAKSVQDTTPLDSNIQYGQDGILYYADPRTEENGLNRVIKVNYKTNPMSFEDVKVTGINPHSIDRAGKSPNKFYVRTQNSYSFDIVDFSNGQVTTVPLDITDTNGTASHYKPRAIGAYNDKYKLQLISGKDMPVVGVIDVTKDSVIANVGIAKYYDKSEVISNAGSGSATGHAIWLDDDHFALIDRVPTVDVAGGIKHNHIKIYKVKDNGNRNFEFPMVFSTITASAIHAFERVMNPKTRKDLVTFYAMGEGILDDNATKDFKPFVYEYIFNPKNGNLERGQNSDGTERSEYFTDSTQAVNGIKPTSHHGGISPDGKYVAIPVLDGKVYFVNRKTIHTEHVVNAKLGAAHIEFSKELDLAVITNHFDKEITIIDMKNFTTTNLNIYKSGSTHDTFDPAHKHLLQPHFSYIGKDGRYFYTFATQDGDFVKVDLKTKQVVDRLHVGGAPEQAHS